MGWLRTFVTDPAAFFEDVRESPSLRWPILVVSAHSLSIVVALVVVFEQLSLVLGQAETTPVVYAVGTLRISAPRELLVGLTFALASFFIAWVGTAAIAYLVTGYFGGEGRFRTLLSLLGWTFILTLVPTLCRNAVVIALVAGAPTLESTEAAQSWLVSSLEGNPILLAVELVRPLVVVWQVGLWVLAVEHARRVTRRQALVAVAIPGLLAAGQALSSYVWKLL